MKIELHVNGKLNVRLFPETTIEQTVLREMAGAAEKGRAVSLHTADDNETVIVSVEQ